MEWDEECYGAPHADLHLGPTLREGGSQCGGVRAQSQVPTDSQTRPTRGPEPEDRRGP